MLWLSWKLWWMSGGFLRRAGRLLQKMISWGCQLHSLFFPNHQKFLLSVVFSILLARAFPKLSAIPLNCFHLTKFYSLKILSLLSENLSRLCLVLSDSKARRFFLLVARQAKLKLPVFSLQQHRL